MPRVFENPRWPVLKRYDADHLARIGLPLGGIGTGTVSLRGRGTLRDWEIMNRPAKGFNPYAGPFVDYASLLLRVKPSGGPAVTRLLEGPIDDAEYEGMMGTVAPNHGFPRFRRASFSAAYPFGQVLLADPSVPLDVRLEAFNPLVPGDADASGIPVAVLRVVLRNRMRRRVDAAVCANLPNFIGDDGTDEKAMGNRNRVRSGRHVRGVFMESDGVDRKAATWGTLALATTARTGLSFRTAWNFPGGLWCSTGLDFWEDFHGDGILEDRPPRPTDRVVMGSLAVRLSVPPGGERAVTFLIAWHFPNRRTWTPCKDGVCGEVDLVGNHYATQYRDAWAVAERTAQRLETLEERTVRFVRAFSESDLPLEAKEAALFNLANLRSQTAFRTADGRLFGWEGCNDKTGCCEGSCTHVWNYEQATAFLFGSLARTMREVEFEHATDDRGFMSFRTHLPLSRARESRAAAADGQMGCILKMYRDWQLCGDDAWLRRLWPKVRKALEFCWLPGGWDADRDGVMEGSQHNTMDCNYWGPNPQMGLWYLGALRAAEAMARHLGESDFAAVCRDLFARGRRWLDAHLFNGEYYEQEIRPPRRAKDVLAGTGSFPGMKKPGELIQQLGAGCLVDQLVGQFMAHLCGLGYLVRPAHVRRTLRSILRYNRRTHFHDHFNGMRGYVLAGEKALLMATYPRGRRPRVPFPYFTEVMTGFEYVAAIGMLYEGMTAAGLRCIRDIRDRYDGRKRNPFDEAECGHHYARAMASWAAVPAWSGFRYSAVTGTMAFAARDGRHFWSVGDTWGTCRVRAGRSVCVELRVLHGNLPLRRLVLRGAGEAALPRMAILREGARKTLLVKG